MKRGRKPKITNDEILLVLNHQQDVIIVNNICINKTIQFLMENLNRKK